MVPSLSVMRNVVLLGAGALTLACAVALPARAGEVQVSPTEVAITPGKPTELLSLINEGDDTLRYELSTFAWRQSADGGMVLERTEDVVAFPLLMTLGPRETKRIRVGVQVPFDKSEKTYRLILQELPNETVASSAMSIRFLAKISLPIFVAPRDARPDPRIGPPSLAGNVVSFAILNNGTAHLMVRRLRAVGVDSAGKSVFDLAVPGWYVLAGGTRDYRLALAEADCRRASRIVLEAETDPAPVRAEFPLACSPGGSAARTEFLKSPGAAQSGTP